MQVKVSDAIFWKIPVKTRFGTFLLEFSETGLCSVQFPGADPVGISGRRIKHPPLRPGVRGVIKRFKNYFDSSRKSFRTQGFDLKGCTPFEIRVYAALRKVPVGKTVTYGELAKRAGYSGAARAVGCAMRKNRLPVVIPCHRVVPASSGLGEYSAGKKWKKRLLEFEMKGFVVRD